MLSRLKLIANIANSYVGLEENTAQHQALVNDYNKIYPHPRGYTLKLKDSWCAAYVSVVMYKAGLLSFPFECGVSEMLKVLYANNCLIKGRLPQAGEILFFKHYSHVGICGGSNPANGDIICNEGNSANMCRKIMYNHNDGTFSYYASPWCYSPDEVVTQVINGWWGNGCDRIRNLKLGGYDPVLIRNAVNKRLGAI